MEWIINYGNLFFVMSVNDFFGFGIGLVYLGWDLIVYFV